MYREVSRWRFSLTMRWRGRYDAVALALILLFVGTLVDFVDAGYNKLAGGPAPGKDIWGASDPVLWTTVIGLVIVWIMYIGGMFRWYI